MGFDYYFPMMIRTINDLCMYAYNYQSKMIRLTSFAYKDRFN